MRVDCFANKVFLHANSIDEFLGWFPEIDKNLFSNINPEEVKITSGNHVFIYTAKK